MQLHCIPVLSQGLEFMCDFFHWLGKIQVLSPKCQTVTTDKQVRIKCILQTVRHFLIYRFTSKYFSSSVKHVFL